MDLSRFRRCSCFLLVALVAGGGVTGCRKRKAPPAPLPAKIASELQRNEVGQWSGPVYQSQAKSPIHWQGWSPKTFASAKAANRLIFAVIALPELPGYQEVLADLERDPSVVKAINDKYVPVLIDGDASREVGLLTWRLCMEIKQPLDLPMFLWLTSEGNPVAWAPVPSRSGENVFRLFNQSDEMVGRMWREDPNYVLTNSVADNQNRRQRILTPGEGEAPSEQPADDSLQAIRQLNSLYDQFSQSIDGAGGLYPSGVMDALAAAALIPGVPENLKARCDETLRSLLGDLLPSAMFDPLTGGVFSARSSTSWTLPDFNWNCRVQARVASNLLRGYQLTGNPAARERALGLLTFAEKNFQQPDGLFSDGVSLGSGRQEWLWSVEDVEKALPAEDAKWWIAATGMQSLGNLPSETDPKRELFRSNTLALVRPLAETAAKLGVSPVEFTLRFEKSREKLLAIRNARLKPQAAGTGPDSANAVASFRMISAYAAAYTATGDELYRGKAVKLLTAATAKFSQGNRLTTYGATGEPSITGGRAFLYALAIQAAQDVADITSDAAPLQWAEQLAASARTNFLIDGVLQEAAADAQLIKLPVSDSQKVFDDTSTGLLALAEARRLAGDADAAGSALKGLGSPLSKSAVRVPILHSDAIVAALVRHHAKSIVVGRDLSPELKTALERLPLQLIPRRSAKDSDGIPAGSVRVVSPDGAATVVSTPSALREELLLPK
jgi:uncharacterized protein YyaL (SSP411 family)